MKVYVEFLNGDEFRQEFVSFAKLKKLYDLPWIKVLKVVKLT